MQLSAQITVLIDTEDEDVADALLKECLDGKVADWEYSLVNVHILHEDNPWTSELSDGATIFNKKH